MKYTNDRYSINKIFALLLVLAVVLTIPVSTASASGDTKASSTTTTTKQTTVSACKDDKHSMPTGNMEKWFNSRSEVQAYVSSVMESWNNKHKNGEITWEEYTKNCPQGYKAWSCSKCGKWTGDFTYGEVPTEPSTSHTHSWDNGVITKSATCTEKGVRTYICNGCSETRTEAIAETGHNYVTTIIRPTCTTGGKTIHKCSKCSSSYEDGVIDATGHDYRYVANNDGTHKKICKVCSDTINNETCNRVKQGNYYVCNECSARYEETSTEPSTEPSTSHTHSWNNGVVTKPATCTEKGIRTYTCNGCSETRTEAIAETGHNYVPTVIKPTCTVNGKTVYTCINCNSSYDADYIDATGHDYRYVANNDGTHKMVCKVCSDTVIESCNKVKQDNSFVCSYCKAVYDDANVTEPSTDPVTKPNPTKPVTEPMISPNESTTDKDNTDVTSAVKGDNKATTEDENGTTDNTNKNTNKKSPNTGAEIIDTGDNLPMNILILCVSAILAVMAVVLLVLKAKQNKKRQMSKTKN